MRRKLGDSGRLFRLAGGFAPPPGPAEGKIGGLLADDVNVVGERTDPGDSGCEDEDRKRIKHRHSGTITDQDEMDKSSLLKPEELIQAQARVLPEPNVVRRISLASEDRPDLKVEKRFRWKTAAGHLGERVA